MAVPFEIDRLLEVSPSIVTRPYSQRNRAQNGTPAAIGRANSVIVPQIFAVLLPARAANDSHLTVERN